MMWMNLDRLPAGVSQYTLYYACCSEDEASPEDHSLPIEEVDVQASDLATREQIEAAAQAQDPELYDWDQLTLIAIGDQSSGYFKYVREGFGEWVS